MGYPIQFAQLDLSWNFGKNRPVFLSADKSGTSLSLMLAVTVPRIMQRAGFTELFLRSARPRWVRLDLQNVGQILGVSTNEAPESFVLRGCSVTNY